MAANFVELLAKYRSPLLIPDADLYACGSSEELLLRLIQDGEEALKNNPLAVEMRRRAKANLYFLAKYFTWGTNPEGIGKDISLNKINRRTHQRVCDLFVKKDDSKSLADQDTRKERVLLYPRGGFKSTIDVADIVQWILNFPDIRILILTAADDLAVGLVDEVKSHFIIRPQNPSMMNAYFPEFSVLEKNLENEFIYNCPVWSRKKIKRKEPTVMASSIASTLSGFHFEVIKADDTVSNKNSENETQCLKVIKNFNINKKMLMPYGYLDRIGTRYADEDMYGDILERNVGDLTRETEPGIEFITNKTTGLQILIGRAIVIKQELIDAAAKEGKSLSYKDVGEEGCHLLFPQNLSYNFLMKEYAIDEVAFEGQYNQNPRPASTTTFDLPLLQSHTVGFDRVPFQGPISVVWDFAFSKKKGRDYSTGCAVIWDDQGAMYLIDLVRARFKPDLLAQAVVDFSLKWRPFVVGIEDAAGSKYLEPTIISKAQASGNEFVASVLSKIDWITPENQKDAKTIRMAALHPWLVNNRMFFVSHLPQLTILYDEFQRCLTSHHHDDIPDAMSRPVKYAPVTKRLIEDKEIQTWSRKDAGWNLIYDPSGELYGGIQSVNETMGDPFGRAGGRIMVPITVPVVTEEDQEVRAETPDGLDPILGAGIFG